MCELGPSPFLNGPFYSCVLSDLAFEWKRGKLSGFVLF